MKLKNTSRRDAIDIEVQARLAMTGLVRPASTETLALVEWRRPHLAAGEEMRLRITPIHLDERARLSYSKYFSPAIRCALEQGEHCDLEEFLEQPDHGRVLVYVLAPDALSGARSLERADYEITDMQVGPFRKDYEHTGVLVDSLSLRTIHPTRREAWKSQGSTRRKRALRTSTGDM